MAYHSSYTGPQIDQAVGNALNKDTSTLSNDVNHIPASSVVKSAIDNHEPKIYNLSASDSSQSDKPWLVLKENYADMPYGLVMGTIDCAGKRNYFGHKYTYNYGVFLLICMQNRYLRIM